MACGGNAQIKIILNNNFISHQQIDRHYQLHQYDSKLRTICQLITIFYIFCD